MAVLRQRQPGGEPDVGAGGMGVRWWSRAVRAWGWLRGDQCFHWQPYGRCVSIVNMRWGRFRARADAGAVLAEAVGPTTAGPVVVLGLPRGGVPVAAEVAARLGGPLDVLAVRKIGDARPRRAGDRCGRRRAALVVRQRRRHRPPRADRRRRSSDRAAGRPTRARRAERPLRRRPPPPAPGRRRGRSSTTGWRPARRCAPPCGRCAPRAGQVVVAVPVGPPRHVAELAEVADDVVCPRRPADFGAVGEWYADFSATTDDDVLAPARRRPLTSRGVASQCTAADPRRGEQPRGAPASSAPSTGAARAATAGGRSPRRRRRRASRWSTGRRGRRRWSR